MFESSMGFNESLLMEYISTNGNNQKASTAEEGEIEDDVQAQVVAETVQDQRDDHQQPKILGSKRSALESGGVYIPPAKRRQLQEQSLQKGEAKNGMNNTENNTVTDIRLQRESWAEQKRVIHGTINRLNAGTIKPLIGELFEKVNLIRLRGVLCKSVLQAAVSSPKYSDVYAALISVINSKLPEVGELCTKRAILAFRRHYRRKEKASCLAICIFLAHLFHQAVVHELIILQLLSVLLDGDPTDDSVEVAVQLLQVTGQALLEVSPAGVRACLERLRALLHEGNLNKRVEYKMEQLLKMRKSGFRESNPPIAEALDLVERDDQITFEISLDDEEIKKEENLDVFSFDPNFDEAEREWSAIRAEILGQGDSETDDSDGQSEDDSDDGSKSESAELADQQLAMVPASSKAVTVVQDLTEEDLINLRRTIYLTIMSSATFEECTHKLIKIEIPVGREEELVNMLIECCSQERTFLRYYGLIAARFSILDDRWRDAFMKAFGDQYTTIHRLETNKLRNVAKLFAHLLHTDSIPWSVLSIIHLNEDETTSSSRIFIKIVVQEMAEAIGIAKLKHRLESDDPESVVWFAGMFPKDNVRNTRYAINFFTSIGLGPLTDDLREFLKNAPKLILQKAQEAALAKKNDDSDSSSETSSSSSSSGSSSSSYDSSSTDDSSTSGSSASESSYSSYSSRRRSRSRRRRTSSSSSPSTNVSRSSSRSSYSSRSSSASSESSSSTRSSLLGRKKPRDTRRRRVSRSRSTTPAKDAERKDHRSSRSTGSSSENKERQRHNVRSRSKSPNGEGIHIRTSRDGAAMANEKTKRINNSSMSRSGSRTEERERRGNNRSHRRSRSGSSFQSDRRSASRSRSLDDKHSKRGSGGRRRTAEKRSPHDGPETGKGLEAERDRAGDGRETAELASKGRGTDQSGSKADRTQKQGREREASIDSKDESSRSSLADSHDGDSRRHARRSSPADSRP